jgi:hypothetical protein
MPQNLMKKQKGGCPTLCVDLAEQLQEDNFFNHVIAGDETW